MTQNRPMTASEMGRKGGASRSEAKRIASQKNGVIAREAKRKKRLGIT